MIPQTTTEPLRLPRRMYGQTCALAAQDSVGLDKEEAEGPDVVR